jgi:hypothetical protein
MQNIPVDIKLAISNASKVTGVSEQILTAFAQIESNFNLDTRSKTGVNGLFQITGNTWKDIWRRVGHPNKPYSKKVNEQALAAAYYIKWLAPQFQNDQNLIAIAYNAGPEVARELIGKPLNNETISRAIYKHYKNDAAKGKAFETSEYPKRLAKALGKEYKIGPLSAPADSSIQSEANFTPPQTTEVADPNKPFFQALTQSARDSMNNLESVTSKLDIGLLRERMANGKLANLIPIATNKQLPRNR